MIRKDPLITAAAFFFLALIFWYQISPIAFKNYDTICKSNYGHSDEYDRCMNPYWSEYNLRRIGIIISLGLAGIFIFKKLEPVLKIIKNRLRN